MTTPATLPTAPAMYPLPFVVASWLGYPMERIVAGLRAGTIAPPLGAPDGWLPSGYADAPDGASSDADDDAGDGDVDDDADTADDDADTADDADDDAEDAADDDGPFPPDDSDVSGAGDDVDVPSDAGSPPSPPFGRDSARDLLGAIDPTLDDARFEAWWTTLGDDDATRARGAEAFVWRQVLGTEPPDAGLEGGPDGGDALAAAIARRAPRGTLVSFAGLGSAAIAALARSDPVALAALDALDDHAFVGLQGAVSRPGRFDASSGERRVSDAWIDDRARFLAWTIANREGADLAQVPGDGWRFVDRTDARPTTLDVGDADGERNQVVFARDGGDRVDGGRGTDRLHGGDGDDALRGADGDDLIGGGNGDDRLAGGGGDDVVGGGAGDDDLAGGAGDDTLGGDSGDDWLEGGRGADRLDGGVGHDVYDYSSGDGHDLVVDSDGDGEIHWDGVTLTGDELTDATDRAVDPDHVAYSLLDDGVGGRTLVIRGVDAQGRATSGEMRVRDWHQGDLGIRLADPVSAADSPTAAADAGPDDGADAAAGPLAGDEVPDAGVSGRLPLAPTLRLDPYREPGNEAGWGTIQGSGSEVSAPLPSPGDSPPVDPAVDDTDGRPLDAGDWARAFDRRTSSDWRLPSAPPDVDAGAVTLADLGIALAVHADDDALDAGYAVLPNAGWPTHDDRWSPAIAPPDAPPRMPR